ncbi:hypothetical protein [uncultured Dysosmobacter sp.]|uniref:hypothetical protein n=1 Tax=uncultured Dysosmobacter sp. TaxID=2591384 RepID=UPI002613863F|nr:hypothetical protein [uncultured Dysosmobacter sp.]
MAEWYYGSLGLWTEPAWSVQESSQYRLAETESFLQAFQLDSSVGAQSILLEPGR